MAIDRPKKNDYILIPNKNYQCFKTRLSNECLISSSIYMTESVYEKIARDSFSLEDISHALAESQFSLGAKNRIETLLKIACPSENTPEPEIIRDFSSLFEVWMSTIDASKAIVNH